MVGGWAFVVTRKVATSVSSHGGLHLRVGPVERESSLEDNGWLLVPASAAATDVE